jgi:diguanylate cyclase (GGDEF)-like protein
MDNGNGIVPPFPVPENEERRLAFLREFDTLYEDQREAISRICDIGRELLDVRTASVTIVDRDRIRFLKRSGAPAPEVARADAMCTWVIPGDELVVMPDLQKDPRFANLISVKGPPFIDFYAGVPLTLDGLAIGTFNVTHTAPRHFGPVELRQLQWLASLVADIMRLHLTQRELHRREQLLAQSSRLARIGGWETDMQTGRLTFSDELYDINEMKHGSPLEMPQLLTHLQEEDRVKLDAARMRLRETGAPFDIEIEFVTAAGNHRWARVMGDGETREGKVVRLFGAVQDITERKQAEAKIQHLAHHDPLTGLANRALFRQRLHSAITESERDTDQFALMLLDFDNFKNVNDTRGHAVGDKLLETAGERLRNMLGTPSTVARLGGDEFALILRDIHSEADVVAKAEQIVRELMQPIDLGEEQLVNGVSIGVTIYPKDDTDASELMKNADIALYLAKSSGRGRAAYFTPSLRQKFEERLALIEEVRRGIEAGEFSLYYQPICSMDGDEKRLKGFEGLMRWRHPRLGLLTPAFFGMAFEESELAKALGEIGLSDALRRIDQWRQHGAQVGYVALNVAPGQIAAGDFFQRVAERVKEARIPRGSLMLEVTESVYLNADAEKIGADLAMLHDLGVLIALDDFGTGYASLTHLKQFPVDLMKIDRSFIRQIGTDTGNTAIARAVINLGRALGIDIVAEGVETSDQAVFLTHNGCTNMQGFLFAQAMPADDVEAFVAGLDTRVLPSQKQRA